MLILWVAWFYILVQYENFVETWSLFDPEATGFLEWHILPDFLAELDQPMGLGKNPMPTAKDLTCLIGEIACGQKLLLLVHYH